MANNVIAATAPETARFQPPNTLKTDHPAALSVVPIAVAVLTVAARRVPIAPEADNVLALTNAI